MADEPRYYRPRYYVEQAGGVWVVLDREPGPFGPMIAWTPRRVFATLIAGALNLTVPG